MVTIYGKNGTTGLLIIKSFGFASICLFFILRSINVYGDQAWLIMPTSIETIMSFMKLTKYPPSLLIILFNVDLGVVLLVLLQKVESKNWIKPLIVFWLRSNVLLYCTLICAQSSLSSCGNTI